MESEIIGLVLEIARKVIKMEVEINRAAALEIVKNTLRRVADSTSLRVRVHADDLETVRANREDLYSLVDTIRKVEIVEDRRVGPGGCILETDAGTIDARIETQMEEIRRLLGGDQPGTA
jgi:flagellar assembly protein FliH